MVLGEQMQSVKREYILRYLTTVDNITYDNVKKAIFNVIDIDDIHEHFKIKSSNL